MIELVTLCPSCGEIPEDCCCRYCKSCDDSVPPVFYEHRISCPYCGNSLAEVDEDWLDDLTMSQHNSQFIQNEVESMNSHSGRM